MSDIVKMTKLIVSSLFKKTACQMYPFKPAKFYKHSRGKVTINASKCILCTLCAKKCPTGAIIVDREQGHWQIDRSKCILCNECVTCCRPVALTMENQHSAPATEKTIDKVIIKKNVKCNDEAKPD